MKVVTLDVVPQNERESQWLIYHEGS